MLNTKESGHNMIHHLDFRRWAVGFEAGVRDHYVVATKGMWPLIHTTERNSSYWVVVYSEGSTEGFRPHLCHCGPQSEGRWNALPGSSSHPRRSAARRSSSRRCPPSPWQRSRQVCLPEQPPVGATKVKGRNSGTTSKFLLSRSLMWNLVKYWIHLQYASTHSPPLFTVKEKKRKKWKKK